MASKGKTYTVARGKIYLRNLDTGKREKFVSGDKVTLNENQAAAWADMLKTAPVEEVAKPKVTGNKGDNKPDVPSK